MLGNPRLLKISLNVALAVLALWQSPVSLALEGYYPVSLTELIVSPDKYLNRNIRVKGFFDVGIFPAIYLNHISAEIGDFASAVEVVDPTSERVMVSSCEGKYVAISARLVMNQLNYEIVDVVEVLEIASLSPCWAQSER